MGHELRRLQARAKVVLAAIEAGDEIAYDLMVRLAEEIVALDGVGQGMTAAAAVALREADRHGEEQSDADADGERARGFARRFKNGRT